MSETPLPPVEEAPTLPDITESVKLDLAISENGQVYIFHEKNIPEQVNWAEYDHIAQRIDLITVSGRIQGLGLKINEALQEQICAATRIFVIYMIAGKTEQIIEIPLVILI